MATISGSSLEPRWGKLALKHRKNLHAQPRCVFLFWRRSVKKNFNFALPRTLVFCDGPLGYFGGIGQKTEGHLQNTFSAQSISQEMKWTSRRKYAAEVKEKKKKKWKRAAGEAAWRRGSWKNRLMNRRKKEEDSSADRAEAHACGWGSQTFPIPEQELKGEKTWEGSNFSYRINLSLIDLLFLTIITIRIKTIRFWYQKKNINYLWGVFLRWEYPQNHSFFQMWSQDYKPINCGFWGCPQFLGKRPIYPGLVCWMLGFKAEGEVSCSWKKTCSKKGPLGMA